MSTSISVPGAGPQASAGQLVLYSIKVNGQDFDVAPILRLRDGSLHARRSDIESWRLRVSGAAALIHEGEEYLSLQALDGFSAKADGARQALEIEFDARAFVPTVLGLGGVAFKMPEPAGWGGFANYDLFATSTRAQASGVSRVDGAFEFGLHAPLGVLVTSVLGQNLAGNAAASDGSKLRPALIRLETTWTRDMPGEASSLQLGDTSGKSGIWGRPVRFGGLRWGTNYATQPGFVTLPLPAIGGQAALPSTVELYIDGMLRQRAALPPGPFQLSNLPVVTGQGQARLVVRDILGREQVITQPYYASNALLKEGLRDESFEFGFVRENFGLRSFDFGSAAGTVTLRRGVSDRFTTEVRGEVLRDQRTAGAGASFIAPLSLVLTVAAAASQSKAGSGQLLFLGADHQSRRIGFGVRSQWTSASFTQLGVLPGQPAPRQQMVASLGAPLGGAGNFGLSYVRQLNRTQVDNEVLAANYSIQVAKSASLNFFGNTALLGNRTRTLGVTLVYAFDDRQSLAASHSAQSGAGQSLLQWQQSLPTGSGYGYRLLAGSGASGERAEAGVSLQTDSGTYTVDAGRAQGISSLRLSAGGGLAIIGGRAQLARRIGEAFALVEVPGYPEVGVYVNNQIVAQTDAQGFAVLPRLLPYQNNPVSIDPAELPLDAQIDATRVDAVPYFRSGLVVTFPVRRSAGALLTLVLEDGAPMPLGAVVTIEGGKEEFPVAQRGEVYVTGLAALNRLQAAWRGQTCAFSVALPADAGPLPNIGPLKCSGVRR